MRPLSPNIQHYRPQSIANRFTAIISAVAIAAFVAWLVAAAVGPQSYASMDVAAVSPVGRALLVIATFAFFLHLCGSIRHLFWDAVVGFELRTIYASGWAVVAASVVLTAATWLIGAWVRS